MDLINSYFGLCDCLCPKDDECTEIPSYYFCIFNAGTLLVVATVFFLRILFLLYSYRSNPARFSIKRFFRQSIFSSLEREYPNISFFLYIMVTHGILFSRPLAFFINTIISSKIKELFSDTGMFFVAVLITSISSTVYFFSVIFLVNFYGIKAEVLLSNGDPTINVKERELFMKMVLQRSWRFSFIFFCGMMINASFGVVPFSITIGSNADRFQWTLRIICYGFASILLIDRFLYVRYSKKMALLNIQKKNQAFNLITFKKHLEEHSVTQEIMLKMVENMERKDENLFIKEFENLMAQKCGLSSVLFEETTKVLNSSRSFYQPMMRNPMENHLAGAAWLFFTLVDGVYNCAAAVILSLYSIINPNKDLKETFAFTMIMVIFGFYVFESTVQALLTYIIVKDKANFGGHLEADFNPNESLHNDNSLFILEDSSGPVIDDSVDHRSKLVSIETFLPEDRDELKKKLLEAATNARRSNASDNNSYSSY